MEFWSCGTSLIFPDVLPVQMLLQARADPDQCGSGGNFGKGQGGAWVDVKYLWPKDCVLSGNYGTVFLWCWNPKPIAHNIRLFPKSSPCLQSPFCSCPPL